MRFIILAFAFLWAAAAPAQNTRSLAPGAKGAAASVGDLAWMVGHWEGKGLGGQSFETISPPVGGQMAGHFQQVKDGKLFFYEIYHFAPKDGSLVLRIKHFSPDLTGWEEKGVTVEFPLVAVEKDAAYFDGLTIRRTGRDRMESFVRIKQKDGTTQEAAFRFRRVRL
jgi:hypothetical protein